MAKTGDTQSNGYLTIEEVISGSQGRSATYVCRCVRRVGKAQCGKLRTVRADVWRSSRVRACKDCTEALKPRCKVDSLWEGVPDDLVRRVASALIVRIYAGFKAQRLLSYREIKEFVADCRKTPIVLEQYEKPQLHREELGFGGYEVYKGM